MDQDDKLQETLDELKELEFEEDLNISKMPKPDYVKMTLSSGILPLEMRYGGIYGCSDKQPLAYITYTYVNSVMSGVIPPEKYQFASDMSDKGIEIGRWNVIHAIDTIKKLKEAHRKFEFVSARVPAKFLLQNDLHAYMKEIFEHEDFHDGEKLCIEIPRTVLFENEEQVRLGMLNLKLLNIKIMMKGFGEKDTPITMLLNLPFDYVILAPWLTKNLTNKDHFKQVEALLAFTRELGAQCIGQGVDTNDQVSRLSRQEAFGFIPTGNYKGPKMFYKLRMTEKEAIEEEEGEDDWQEKTPDLP